MKRGRDICCLSVLLLMLSGCVHTEDALKPDEAPDLNPALCPDIEGWFSPWGQARRSSGKHRVRPELPDILMDLGMLDYAEVSGQDMAKPMYVKVSADKMETRIRDRSGGEKSQVFLI